VLGSPDNQAFGDQADAYDELVGSDSVTPMKIAPPGEEGWLLGLGGAWFRCAIQMDIQGKLLLSGMAGGLIGGMSGSPIVSAEGAAIGVACLRRGRRRRPPD
jgi:hypothetical protein